MLPLTHMLLGALLQVEPSAPTPARLRVVPIGKTQSLQIHLSRPNGMPIHHDVQVSIESLVMGLTLFRSEPTAHDFTYSADLPVGRYRLRVETEDNVPLCISGWLPKPAPFGDWVEIVDLDAGQPVAIESILWLGGKLRLALEVPRGMESRD